MSFVKGKMTNNVHNIYLVLSLSLLFLARPTVAKTVVSFGAKPDGKSDSTQAFKKAWSWACSSSRATTITVPKGNFVVRPIYFSGPCRNQITIMIQGKILSPSDYRVLAQSKFWLMFYKVNGITIIGGTIDARAHEFWSCRHHHGYCYTGAKSISFIWCNNVKVHGLTSMNSQMMHVGVVSCSNVDFKNLKIRAPSGSPNTDGIHVQHSNRVTIYNSVIQTGDDCISIGPGTKNVQIERIVCGPGHGISIGSLGNSLYEDGVQNVTVSGSSFWKTQNGVRIKSWARPSNSFVRGIVFRNLLMYDVYNPIIIDQQYCPSNQCPHQASGVKIRGVKYRNIRGTSASKIAVALHCSSSNPCGGIKLQDIKLTYNRSPAISSCKYAHGSSRGTVIPRSCF